jgi:hypothetical protein
LFPPPEGADKIDADAASPAELVRWLGIGQQT